MPEGKEKLRIDKYLWAIRVFKTRSAAADACEKGRVRLKGESVKASRAVNQGDEYDIRSEQRKWVIRVTAPLDHRVQFTEAVRYYEDLTPPEDKEGIAYQAAIFYSGKRQTKIGRPTKKERRDLDGFLDD